MMRALPIVVLLAILVLNTASQAEALPPPVVDQPFAAIIVGARALADRRQPWRGPERPRVALRVRGHNRRLWRRPTMP